MSGPSCPGASSADDSVAGIVRRRVPAVLASADPAVHHRVPLAGFDADADASPERHDDLARPPRMPVRASGRIRPPDRKIVRQVTIIHRPIRTQVPKQQQAGRTEKPESALPRSAGRCGRRWRTPSPCSRGPQAAPDRVPHPPRRRYLGVGDLGRQHRTRPRDPQEARNSFGTGCLKSRSRRAFRALAGYRRIIAVSGQFSATCGCGPDLHRPRQRGLFGMYSAQTLVTAPQMRLLPLPPGRPVRPVAEPALPSGGPPFYINCFF
jgi:hypothetical protein